MAHDRDNTVRTGQTRSTECTRLNYVFEMHHAIDPPDDSNRQVIASEWLCVRALCVFAPVDGWEVLLLCELLVQSPEHLHDGQRGGRDGIGEISTGGRHGTHDGHGALALGQTHAAHAAGALVEEGQTRSEVGRVSGITGHLTETSGNLSQSLGPSRRGVGHHGHIVTHVAEVLGQRDTRVDGCLAGGHRHVGRVGHKARALHDGNLLIADLGGQLGEIGQH